jgi:hypothetical protein
LLLFFDQVTDDERSYGHFMQTDATPHTAGNSIDAADEVFAYD